MKTIALSFASSRQSAWWGHASGRRWRLTSALMLLIVAGLAGVQLWQSWQLWQAQAAVRTELRAVEAGRERALAMNGGKPSTARTGTAAPTSAQAQALRDHRSALNRIVRQLNTPWSAVFDALERQTPDDIAILAIEPDSSRGTIRLQAEAKSLDPLLAYAQSLQGRGVLGQLVLIKHETNEQDANKPIRLSFELAIDTTRHDQPRSGAGEKP
jgi:Tfp pilus assembly protein PilN